MLDWAVRVPEYWPRRGHQAEKCWKLHPACAQERQLGQRPLGMCPTGGAAVSQELPASTGWKPAPHWHFHPCLPLAPVPFSSGKQEAIEGRRKTTAGAAIPPRSAGRGSSRRRGPLSQQPCDDAMPRSQRSREGARPAGAGLAPVVLTTVLQGLARGLACLISTSPGAAGQLSYSA